LAEAEGARPCSSGRVRRGEHIFFGRRHTRAALAEMGALLAALTGFAVAARRIDRTAALMAIPCVAWIGFETVLNAEIVRRNG
jgi:translocator protein